MECLLHIRSHVNRIAGTPAESVLHPTHLFFQKTIFEEGIINTVVTALHSNFSELIAQGATSLGVVGLIIVDSLLNSI